MITQLVPLGEKIERRPVTTSLELRSKAAMQESRLLLRERRHTTQNILLDHSSPDSPRSHKRRPISVDDDAPYLRLRRLDEKNAVCEIFLVSFR